MQFFTVKNKTELLDRLISKEDTVLDIGFWGQGVKISDDNWPHKLLKEKAAEVYGIDIEYDELMIPEKERSKYKKVAAEDFYFDRKFDVIFAGDLIEHLVNPGLFLDNAKKHLNDGGRLILTTPNTFNLFNLAGKLTRAEPVVNSDHTFYFNQRTIGVLLSKCGWDISELGYMYTLDYKIKESFKKKFLNFLYWFLAKWTPKYYETMVVVARREKSSE